MSKWRKISLFIFFAVFLLSFLFKKSSSNFSLSHYREPFLAFKEKLPPFPYFLLEKTFFQANLSPIQIFSQAQASLELPKRKEILEYTIEPGDTIENLAQKFSLSKETILWANDLSENSKLKPGQTLIILPVDGVLHQVKKGETLFDIAKKYKADIKEIIEFNEFEEETIFPGDILIVPGGKMPPKERFSPQFAQISSSYFMCPLPPCRITQGLHWFNAVDFSNGKCGEYVLAAAEGKVIFAKYGWNGGGGNTIKILHPNGTITQYGHLKEILVKIGEEVFRGQPIGTVGGGDKSLNSGISTGCHLHFGVIGAKNPFAR
ncbi:LysM peptidoglycan-binding domain-containing protein [Candidatus Parcubacteria bacterium]|nr:LysM peptidoglycan-binding domain-containing protein [Candidatus Parcubacteria bacterium]